MPHVTSEHKIVFNCVDGNEINIPDCINPISIPEIGKEYVFSSLVENKRYKFVVKNLIFEFHDNFTTEQVIYVEYETVE